MLKTADLFFGIVLTSFALSFLNVGKGVLKAIVFAFFATTLATIYSPVVVHAEETKVEKIQNELEDMKTEAKIHMRKQKKAIREATDNKSVKEDLRDAALNVQDRISNEARKIKRKLD